MRALAFCCLFPFAVMITTGCGSTGKDYKLHSGKGQLVGSIPEGGTILFFPIGDADFVSKSAIQADGTFALSTHMAKSGKTLSGAPVGEYRVRIQIANSMNEIGEPDLPAKIVVKQDDPLIQVPLSKKE